MVEKKVIVRRKNKTVYDCGDRIIKSYDEGHPKSNVFNEALNQARVEETGLNVPKVLSVEKIDDKWSVVTEKIEGKTLEQLMNDDNKNIKMYLERFVDLQLQINEKNAPLLNSMRDKFKRQINSCKLLDATTRYDILTRLEGMKKHKKVCHGDFNPSNVIVTSNGKLYVTDWAHATKGNSSADAATSYLLFALKDREIAELYLDIFCKKADIAKQYVQKWLSIVAASRLANDNEENKEFYMSFVGVVDWQ